MPSPRLVCLLLAPADVQDDVRTKGEKMIELYSFLDVPSEYYMFMEERGITLITTGKTKDGNCALVINGQSLIFPDHTSEETMIAAARRLADFASIAREQDRESLMASMEQVFKRMQEKAEAGAKTLGG